MNGSNPPGALLPLVTQLKACPSRDNTVSEQSLFAAWDSFREIDLEHGDVITPAVMAGIILHDEEFASLLTETERAQLQALGQAALERYRQQAHPPNKLGKLIAATLKEKP